MMDSAALYHTVSPAQTPRQARLCLSMGIRCLRSMARALRIPHDDDPLPTVGIRALGTSSTTAVGGCVGQLPRRATSGRFVAPLPGMAGQLRAVVDALTHLVVPPPSPWFMARPELGTAGWPVVFNRTPDAPEGAQGPSA